MVFSRRFTSCRLNVKGRSGAVYGLTSWIVKRKLVEGLTTATTGYAGAGREVNKNAISQVLTAVLKCRLVGDSAP